MILQTFLFDRVNKFFDMVDRSIRKYAVTKIKDMAGGVAKLFENVLNFLSNSFRLCEEHRRVQVPLQCYFRSEQFSPLPNVHRPVQTQDLASAIGNSPQ